MDPTPPPPPSSPPADSDAAGTDVRAYVSWKVGAQARRLALTAGRYLIGDSAFAAIRVADAGQSLCGAFLVTETATVIKCLGPYPIMFLEGRKLVPGDSVLVGDTLEFMVGNVGVVVSGAGVSGKLGHVPTDAQADKAARARERGSSDTFLEQLQRAFAHPDRLRLLLSRRLLDDLNVANVDLSNVDSPEVRETTRLKLHKLVADLDFPVGFPFAAEEIERQVFDEVMGLGPLEPLLADPTVTEIMVNRRDQIYLERGGQLTLSKTSFSSDQALLNVIERIVSTIGRRIDVASPIVDARLLDGSRVNAVIPPLAVRGPCVTIRRFSKKPIGAQKLVEWGSMSQEVHDFLKALVENHKNVIISGGTGSGKTTLLNALSSFIPANERIVTVEDAAELQLQQDHVVSLETRPANLEGAGAVTIRDLVKNTLRMRPDRIIVGECRGGEALDMLQAMNTGHDGSMTTAHANSPEDVLRRIETMVMMAGMDLPLRAIREQVASAVTFVVQQTRRKTGRRLVTDVAWIRSLRRDTGEYDVVPLFSRNAKDELVLDYDRLEEVWEVEEFGGDLAQVIKAPKGRRNG